MKKTPSSKKRRPGPLRDARIEKLIERATVDAFDETEQRVGFFTMLENDLALPFDTKILGATTTVEGIDFSPAEEIVALCRRGQSRQQIPILDLPLPRPAPPGAQWIDAYRRWVRRT